MGKKKPAKKSPKYTKAHHDHGKAACPQGTPLRGTVPDGRRPTGR